MSEVPIYIKTMVRTRTRSPVMLGNEVESVDIKWVAPMRSTIGQLTDQDRSLGKSSVTGESIEVLGIRIFSIVISRARL